MKFDGSKLKQIRLKKGLRQSDIAAKTKELGLLVDSRTLSNWENSPKANPRPQNVAVVARVLDIQPEELYTFEPSSYSFQDDTLSSPVCSLLTALGYVISVENKNILLRSSGRTNDIKLTTEEFSELDAKTKEFLEFLLYRFRK